MVVGAGIVGLAHAALAAARGLTVTVVERDERAVGASVRNFGHCCITAQSGDLYELAQRSRRHWLDFAQKAGFWASQAGAIVVARSETELRVLSELREMREADQVRLLDRGQVISYLRSDSGAPDPTILGGALLRDDLRVDPRTTAAKLAKWLSRQPGVSFRWKTSALGFDDGVVRTSRGAVHGRAIVVCVGHDVDYLFPKVASEHVLERCALQMSRAEQPAGLQLAPAVLTATSMLRYEAFTQVPSAAALRRQVDTNHRQLQDIGANVMFTQHPDGSLILGDSHRYQHTADPFLTEDTTEVLNREIAELLGTDLSIVERWQGVYASSPTGPLLIREAQPGVTVVSVTSGVGMTVSFGLAERVIDSLFTVPQLAVQSR